MGKFIINFTPNGMIPTKGMTPYVPIDADEIVKEVLNARKFGISIVHLHARDPEGKPTWKKEIYKKIIDKIRAVDGYSNDSLIICVSTSGRNWPDFERRSECLDLKGASKPDMGSLTLSSLNFPGSASVSSPEMIQKLALKMKANGIKPELEVFDAGMINFAKYLQKKGIIEPPFYFNAIFGNISNAQSGMLDAGYLLTQLPENSYWSFGGIGKSQLPMNTMGILHGGGIRVGLEDNIYFDGDREHFASNKDLLERINEIASLLGSAPNTPAEVREMLNMQVE